MDATESNSVSLPPKRRWYQYSLRSLMAFMFCCLIVCSWFGLKVQRARQQKNAFAALKKMTDCTFYYDRYGWVTVTNADGQQWRCNCDVHGCPWDLDLCMASPQPTAWEKWAGSLFGEHFVRHIVTVELPSERIDEAIPLLKQLPDLRAVLIRPNINIVDGHDVTEVDATVERVKHAMPTVDVVGIRYDLNLNSGDDTKQIGPKTAGLQIGDSVRICWTHDTTEAVAGAASWIGLLIAL